MRGKSNLNRKRMGRMGLPQTQNRPSFDNTSLHDIWLSWCEYSDPSLPKDYIEKALREVKLVSKHHYDKELEILWGQEELNLNCQSDDFDLYKVAMDAMSVLLNSNPTRNELGFVHIEHSKLKAASPTERNFFLATAMIFTSKLAFGDSNDRTKLYFNPELNQDLDYELCQTWLYYARQLKMKIRVQRT